MAVEIGERAHEFVLWSDDKRRVSSKEFAGKNLLLVFFPQAFTGVCTAELCELRDHLHQYTDLNAQVVAISVDSVNTLAKFKELEGFNFPLLSDFNREISPIYGAYYDEFGYDMRGVSKRAAFVIDKEGIIRYAEVLDNAGNVPNFVAIKETLATLA